MPLVPGPPAPYIKVGLGIPGRLRASADTPGPIVFIRGTFSGPRGSGLIPPLAAHSVKAFGEAAFFDEGGGLGFQLAIEQVAAEVQERERGISHQFR